MAENVLNKIEQFDIYDIQPKVMQLVALCSIAVSLKRIADSIPSAKPVVPDAEGAIVTEEPR